MNRGESTRKEKREGRVIKLWWHYATTEDASLKKKKKNPKMIFYFFIFLDQMTRIISTTFTCPVGETSRLHHNDFMTVLADVQQAVV